MAYHRKDAFYLRAKRAGYRSRAAYKLRELAQRQQLIKRGDVVIDLGAWPGGWLQVAAECVGAHGIVAGVDLRPIEPLPAPVTTVVGDISDSAVRSAILQRTGRRADVLLSDLAPKLSGVRARDEAQAMALCEMVLAASDELLRGGGTLLMKTFMSPALEGFVARLRARFATVRTTRPEATRKTSAELYAIGLNFRGAPA